MNARPSRIKKLAAAGILSVVALGSTAAMTGTAHAYVAKITVQDLKDAGAKAVTGGGYVLNGKLYDCGGTQYCVEVKPSS